MPKETSMNFETLAYKKINIDAITIQIHELIDRFNNASSFDYAIKIYMEFVDLRNDLDTTTTLCNIRYTQDTTNAFFMEEMDYVDSITPELTALFANMNQSLLDSSFRPELEAHFGSYLFQKLDISVKIYSDMIKEDLKTENKLVSEYVKLLSSAAIDFEGEIRNISQMIPFMQHTDRSIRKSANEHTYGFMESHVEEFDKLYDQLVKIRASIATKLGYASFVDVGYLRMGRLDYSPSMVKIFRDQVVKEIVPLASKLVERQQKRLKLDTLKYYDLNYKFNSGNPKPQGDANWIIDRGLQMYDALSTETGTFFREMHTSKLLDLVARTGKSNGGYCAYLPSYKMPFVFSNFNGTDGDITVLTHEIGHAFQGKLSSHIAIQELADPTAEAAEIHSMSMEFLTYPWMESFFGQDTDKFTFAHLSDGILFIPYACCVDEFQHSVFADPSMTPDQRHATWRQLEKKYMPYIDYDAFSYLEKGGRWQKQAHIYEVPFYYIDYALAQLCAYQFFVKSLQSRETAWEKYIQLCRLGGTKPFTQLLKTIDFESPFTSGTIKSVIDPIEVLLDQINDFAY